MSKLFTLRSLISQALIAIVLRAVFSLVRAEMKVSATVDSRQYKIYESGSASEIQQTQKEAQDLLQALDN